MARSTCREALGKMPIPATARGHCTGRGPLDISSWGGCGETAALMLLVGVKRGAAAVENVRRFLKVNHKPTT